MGTLGQRLLGAAVLLVAGMVSLPVSAYFLDGSGTENLVVPAQLLAMAGVGAATAAALPALAPSGAGTGKRLAVGACWGVAGAVTGVAGFWFLLNGLGGA
jgi:hypothetical protein